MVKTKEKIFLEFINDIIIGNYSIKIFIDTFPHKIEYFNSKGEWLIDYKQTIECVWINSKIWTLLETKYNMDYFEISSFIKNILFKYLKMIAFVVPAAHGCVNNKSFLVKKKL